MTIEWIASVDDGGCPIIGYAIFMDNGLGTFTEVNVANDLDVRGIPGLD
jgi:hypothetical protein